jgi:hypothetical protein
MAPVPVKTGLEERGASNINTLEEIYKMFSLEFQREVCDTVSDIRVSGPIYGKLFSARKKQNVKE